VKSLLRLFFRLLYHQFAFSYDLVAAAVSFNRWNDWVASVIPFIEGRQVLEVGHGPGHLQRVLRSRGLLAIGIDESPQMGRLAQRNLKDTAGPPTPRSRGTSVEAGLPERPGSPSSRRSSQISYTQTNLVRGVAQHLPFPNESFDTILATFPSEYINDPNTLAEIRRCLSSTGRTIVLPVALPSNRFLDWLFKVTDQRPVEALDLIRAKLEEPFLAANFETEIKTLDVKSGLLLVVVATKKGGETAQITGSSSPSRE
jgi:ubiquinone/menaquinone biosynthesis C-methylase UbiE